MKTSKLLIIIFLITVFPVKAFAALPDIVKAIEPKMHDGTSEEILSFLNERLMLAVQLATDAEAILEQTDTPEEQEALAGAVEIFHGLPSQFQRLKSELKKSTNPAMKPPTLGAAPYSPVIFYNIRSFQKEIAQHLVEHTKNIDRIGSKLVMVKSNLETLLIEYSKIQQKDSDKAIAFEKAAYIFSLQSEYSLFTLQLSRFQKQMDSLHVLRKEGIELIKSCLRNINISVDDVAKAKKRLEKATLEEEALFEEVRNTINNLDNSLLRYELQLENVEGKLEKEKETCDNRTFLKFEKKRITSIIDTIEIKQQGLEQKKTNMKINAIGVIFSYYWMNYFSKHEDEKKLREALQFWRIKQEKLVITANLQNETLLQVSLRKNQSSQKLLLVADELKTMPSQLIKDALLALERQLLKENELIDTLISTLLDNQNDIRVISEEISWFLDLLQAEMPLHENLQIYFEKNLRESWGNIQSVLHYPFFSVGETNLTLTAILKFIFLLIVGLAVLRLVRRKSAVFLRKKAHLSIGSVTSITTLGYYVAVVFSVFAILSTVGVNLSQLTVIVGALGVGIGFGLQAIANNFISGIILLMEQTIKAGDIINLESSVTGEVKKIALRSTIIRTVNGDDVIVPNSELISSRVNTWTYGDDWRRLTVPFGVSYGSDPDEIVRLAEEAAREVEITEENADHPVRVFFEGYGDSSLDFSIRVWCRMFHLRALSGLRSDYYFALFRKLKNAGIEIPFPQRDLHLQSISAKAENSLKKIVDQETDENTHKSGRI